MDTSFNYDLLAKAIVTSAAEEYKRNRFIIETIDKRKYKDEETKERVLRNAQREVDSVEIFFKSEWFNILSGIDGEKAFESLKETYINEYYPMRMEDERNGKGWFTTEEEI